MPQANPQWLLLAAIQAGDNEMDEMLSILAFTRRVTASLDAKDVIAGAVSQIGKLLQPDHVFFFLKEDEACRQVSSWQRPGVEAGIGSKLPAAAEWLCGVTARTGKLHFTPDIPAEPGPDPAQCSRASLRSMASVALEVHGRTLGIIVIASLGERDFRADSTLLEALADVTASALHSALLNEQLNRKISALNEEALERERVEAVCRRFGRALRMWGGCHRALARSATESALLDGVCRAIVELGGYRLAWVGYAMNDENRRVRPVAQAGFEEGYLEGLDLTWSDSERGRGPTGTAIRTARTVVIQDIGAHPRFTPWIEAARRRGSSSTIALPLRVEGRPVGVLRIYSGEPSAFGEDEVTLLEDLAEDLAFGIEALRARAERQKFRESLKDLTELNQQIVSWAIHTGGLPSSR